MLASDGIANVGLSDPDSLTGLIRERAGEGFELVTVGVGMGGFNDELMEQLANRGDGFYAYVDDAGEADRLFGDELVSSLLTVAADGKIQVEFDPDNVSRYRLIGFENRAVLDDDFRNDASTPASSAPGTRSPRSTSSPFSPGVGPTIRPDRSAPSSSAGRIPTIGSVSIETRLELTGGAIAGRPSGAPPSDDFRLAVTVATWPRLLRGSPIRRRRRPRNRWRRRRRPSLRQRSDRSVRWPSWST